MSAEACLLPPPRLGLEPAGEPRFLERMVDYQVWSRTWQPCFSGFHTASDVLRWRDAYWPEALAVRVVTTVSELV